MSDTWDDPENLGLLAPLTVSALTQRLRQQPDPRPWQPFDQWAEQTQRDRLHRWGYRP